jgi:hypothetical protein
MGMTDQKDPVAEQRKRLRDVQWELQREAIKQRAAQRTA